MRCPRRREGECSREPDARGLPAEDALVGVASAASFSLQAGSARLRDFSPLLRSGRGRREAPGAGSAFEVSGQKKTRLAAGVLQVSGSPTKAFGDDALAKARALCALIGRAPVCIPAPNSQIVCRLLH